MHGTLGTVQKPRNSRNHATLGTVEPWNVITVGTTDGTVGTIITLTIYIFTDSAILLFVSLIKYQPFCRCPVSM